MLDTFTFLAAMEMPKLPEAVPRIAGIPEWANTLLWILGVGMVLLFLAWLALRIMVAMHRKAYNLTKAETEKAGQAPKPSFLTVDHEAREEQIRRGEDYESPKEREDREEAAAAEAAARASQPRWGVWARLGAVIIAVAHIGVAVLAGIAMYNNASKVRQDLSTASCIQEVIAKYWLGFVLALIVIVAEIVFFVRSRKKHA
ncbi:MAG: hypothetical protein JXP34_03135 [Planctomycetes bacterium]|nr:hypothetical protein [Planctomycetota bacterium]